MAEMPGCVERRKPGWNLNRPSLRSGYKLLSAPDGRCTSKIYSFSCSLHIASHPKYPHQKQKRTAYAIRFIFGGDSWNRTNDLMHVKHAL